MLVPFAIDAESLSAPDLPWTAPAMRACSRNLLDFWRHLGLLVHDGERFDGSKLQQAVAGLPPNLRALWQAMLQHNPPIPGGAGWDGTLHPALSDALRATFDVGFVDDTKAFVEFGMTEEQDSECRRAQDAKRDVPVPLSPCARRQPLCPGSPRSGPRLRHDGPPRGRSDFAMALRRMA